MKISREKNIITIVVEELDCPKGIKPEIYADILSSVLKIGKYHEGRFAKAIVEDAVVMQEIKMAAQNFKEKWEL
jgi:hypothetical protein